MEPFALFSGTANPGLADAVARQLGVPLGACAIQRFPDGEVSIQLGEPLRRREVYLIQSTAPPVNDHLMELLLFVDACRRAAATRVSAIMPYFGYSRADKRQGKGEAISASLVAHLCRAAGIDHVVTVDPHAPQLEGFFHTPVDSLSAVPALCAALRQRLPPDAVVVAPDAGRVKMATQYADQLDAPLVVLHKRRESGTRTTVTHLVGDVHERPCLVIDDMISTGGTIIESIHAIREAGARPEVVVAATHGLLVGGASERLRQAGVCELFVSDTVAQTEAVWPELRVVSIAPLIAETVRGLARGDTVAATL